MLSIIRRMRFGIAHALAFAAGVGVAQLQPTLPAMQWVYLALAGAGVCIAGCYALFTINKGGDKVNEVNNKKTTRLCNALALTALFLIGGAYATERASARQAPALPDELIWKDITIEGVVYGFPTANKYRTRFDMNITRIVAPYEMAVNFNARLSDYHRDAEPLDAIASGNRLRLQARLRPPTATVNPHNFDYAGYLFANDIKLVGYARKRKTLTLMEDDGGGWRRQLRERIFASNIQHPALLAALLIGDRSEINDDQWQVLRHSGTAHLVSVSGVHIGLIFLLVALLFGTLWRLSGRLTTLLPAQAAAMLLGLAAALGYALLAGFAVPVQRSFIMAATMVLVVFIGGAGALFTALSVALTVVLLLDPWAILSPGFWLSFIMTAFVIAAAKSAGGSLLWKIVGIHTLLSVVIMPLTLWFFNEASLVSPPANILAVPLVGFVILPLAVAGVALGEWCWWLADWALSAMWWYLSWLVELPYAVVFPAQPPLWLLCVGMAGASFMLLPRGVPGRLFGIIPIIAALMWSPATPAHGQLKMTVMDVGQGTGIVLQTRNSVVVYDTGRALGGYIIANYLRGKGIGRIDKIIVSHDDYDHRGGLDNLRREYRASGGGVGELIASDGDRQCFAPDSWRYDGVKFTVLHPHANAPSPNKNDGSCVLLVETTDGKRVLLTGDISTRVEDTINAPADILLVAHHGSGHSSDSAFLSRTGARLAVITVGRNDYNHPHPQVISRLANSGSEIYRTDHDGALIIELKEDISVKRWRQERRRYWLARYGEEDDNDNDNDDEKL